MRELAEFGVIAPPVPSGNSNRPAFMRHPGSSNEAIRLTAHDIPVSLHLSKLSDSRCDRISGHYGIDIGDKEAGDTARALELTHLQGISPEIWHFPCA